MLSYRLGTVNNFHWDFKPVFRYSKPHTYSTFIGECPVPSARLEVFPQTQRLEELAYQWTKDKKDDCEPCSRI